MIAEAYTFAEVEGGLGLFCIRKRSDDKTLCGRYPRQRTVPKGFWPEAWEEVDPACSAAYLRRVAVAQCSAGLRRVLLGWCPACNTQVEAVDGRVQPHRVEGVGCVGVNLKANRRKQ